MNTPIAAESIFEQTGRLTQEADLLRHEVSDLRHFLRNLQDIADLVDNRHEHHNLSTLVDNVLWKILDAIEAEEGTLLLVDEATHELVYVAGSGGPPADLRRGERMAKDRGLAGWVVENAAPMVMENPQAGRHVPLIAGEDPWGGALTVVAAPLTAGGRVMGVVEILHRRRAPFSPERLDMLTLACRFAGELLHSLETRPEPQPPPEAY